MADFLSRLNEDPDEKRCHATGNFEGGSGDTLEGINFQEDNAGSEAELAKNSVQRGRKIVPLVLESKVLSEFDAETSCIRG